MRSTSAERRSPERPRPRRRMPRRQLRNDEYWRATGRTAARGRCRPRQRASGRACPNCTATMKVAFAGTANRTVTKLEVTDYADPSPDDGDYSWYAATYHHAAVAASDSPAGPSTAAGRCTTPPADGG